MRIFEILKSELFDLYMFENYFCKIIHTRDTFNGTAEVDKQLIWRNI